MDSIIEVNVQGSRGVSLNESTRAAPEKGVTGSVAMFRVSLGFDNDAGSLAPDQLTSDKGSRASQRIAFEKGSIDHRGFFTTLRDDQRSTMAIRISPLLLRPRRARQKFPWHNDHRK